MLFQLIKPVHFTEEAEVQRKVSDLAQCLLGWCNKWPNPDLNSELSDSIVCALSTVSV